MIIKLLLEIPFTRYTLLGLSGDNAVHLYIISVTQH